MEKQTFVEKLFGSKAGSIVFRKPNIVLTHDNTSSIINTFKKMKGENLANPEQPMIVLDHNAPPTNAKLANDYQKIRNFVKDNDIKNFHDAGKGICHQLMADFAKPGMIIVGSDSHTCTAGAFNAFAAGIDRTEAAGLWKQGETWFRVPQSIKITLVGRLKKGVYAKDLSLYIIGMIGSSGADYLSIEYHGPGVKTLSIEERMTLTNLASEMGAKNAVFPKDLVLDNYLATKDEANFEGIWADEDASYLKEININLDDIYPLIAIPHHVDNVKSVAEMQGQPIQQAVVGTCTNGRIEDLRIVADVLKDKKVNKNVQLLIIPASRKIYLQAIKEGLIEVFFEAGANVLSASCGPCLGTGQGIPADDYHIISTANRNFKGRMGNKNSFVYLASPEVVAQSAIEGKITMPNTAAISQPFPYQKEKITKVVIDPDTIRRELNTWDYSDIDNLNTDLMFAGNLTYTVNSSDSEGIIPHLFKDFDPNFSDQAKEGDIIIAGANFGCGSSREHPAVGLAHIGIQAVICKSVNRIFYRSSVNQGLPIIILPEAVNYYRKGMPVIIDFIQGEIHIAKKVFSFTPLPEKLLNIFEKKGLVNYILEKA